MRYLLKEPCLIISERMSICKYNASQFRVTPLYPSLGLNFCNPRNISSLSALSTTHYNNHLGSSLPRNQKRHFGGVVNARACYSRKEISRTARSFGSESSNLSGVGFFFDFFAFLWAFFLVPGAILKCGGSIIFILLLIASKNLGFLVDKRSLNRF